MYEKGITRVNDIIEAAICEFTEKGYPVTSMESIAKRAGLSKGGLYHHFNSKVEILLAVNQRFLEPVQEIMKRLELCNSVADRLLEFMHQYLKYWDNHRRELNLYFLTMNESFGNKKIMTLYQESTRGIFAFFEALYLEGQESGIFRNCDAYARAVSLISCLDGYLGYMLIEPSLTPEKVEAEIRRIFVNDLLKV